MIRIFMSGPSGTGKSILAKRIAKKLNILYISNRPNYTLEAQKTESGQLAASLQRFQIIADAIYLNQSFICDRSPIDSILYDINYGFKNHKYLKDIAYNLYEQANFIINIIPDREIYPIENDGVRDVKNDDNLNKLFEKYTKFLEYKYPGIKTITLKQDYFNRMERKIINFIRG